MDQVILVVEDDPVQWRNYDIALANIGYRCDFAADSEAALGLITQREYCLVILDLGIGPSSAQVEDGLDDPERGERLFGGLRTLTKAPIIVATIYKRSIKGDAVLKRIQPQGVIEKPFLPEDLQELVQNILVVSA